MPTNRIPVCQRCSVLPVDSTLTDQHNLSSNSIIRYAEQMQIIHYNFTAQNSDLTLNSQYKKLNNPEPNLFETNVIGRVT